METAKMKSFDPGCCQCKKRWRAVVGKGGGFVLLFSGKLAPDGVLLDRRGTTYKFGKYSYTDSNDIRSTQESTQRNRAPDSVQRVLFEVHLTCSM